MKKSLLVILALALALGVQAKEWEWGTPTWNVANGKVYEDVFEVNAEGIILSYPNPSKFVLTAMNVLSVSYNLYVDDATEPIELAASALRQTTDVILEYDWVEGHSYRIETTGAALCQLNLATFKTDTVSLNKTASYSLSFSIKAPDVVDVINVEGTMALSIVDQLATPTFSLIDVSNICEKLGINSIDEAEFYGLNPNGSYNIFFFDPRFDFWRDADGGLSVWSGSAGNNVYSVLGHNPYPAVYSIKLNETCDSVFYYFYDYWRDYDPDEPSEVPGSGSGAKRRAPATSFHNVVWDWEWVDEAGQPQVTQYMRSYRVDEGEDYKGGFAIRKDNKVVLINATLHFVSQEAYAQYLETPVEAVQVAPVAADGIYSLSGVPQATLKKGLNIVRKGGEVKTVLVP